MTVDDLLAEYFGSHRRRAKIAIGGAASRFIACWLYARTDPEFSQLWEDFGVILREPPLSPRNLEDKLLLTAVDNYLRDNWPKVQSCMANLENE